MNLEQTKRKGKKKENFCARKIYKMNRNETTDLTKDISLHDIGLSSIPTPSEEEYVSDIDKEKKTTKLKSSKQEKNWLETCIEIRELSLHVFQRVRDVPVHSIDQQKFVRDIVIALIQKIKTEENKTTVEESDLGKKYNELKSKYQRTKAKIHVLESQISELEKNIQNQNALVTVPHKKHSNHVKHQNSNDSKINSSIEQIAKLVEQQTKNQQKLIEAVISQNEISNSRKTTKKQKHFQKIDSKSKFPNKKQKQKHFHGSDDDAVILPKNHRQKPDSPYNAIKQNFRQKEDMKLFSHINELVGKTNDIQRHLVDFTGNEDLTLSKLSLLNESLLEAERKFYQQQTDYSSDYSD